MMELKITKRTTLQPDVELEPIIELDEDQGTIDSLKCEIAYLKGQIAVYEKFLKDKGFLKEGE